MTLLIVTGSGATTFGFLGAGGFWVSQKSHSFSGLPFL